MLEGSLLLAGSALMDSETLTSKPCCNCRTKPLIENLVKKMHGALCVLLTLCLTFSSYNESLAAE